MDFITTLLFNIYKLLIPIFWIIIFILLFNKMKNSNLQYTFSTISLILLVWYGTTITYILIYASPNNIAYPFFGSIFFFASSLFFASFVFNLNKPLHRYISIFINIVLIWLILSSINFVKVCLSLLDNAQSLLGALTFGISFLILSYIFYYKLKYKRVQNEK
jgi:hypothetical protein